jgi:hypothetical protein
MSSNYETLYGVHLLDDLHNYFPALLYDSSGFGSVRDVLAYVQQQTRNRFDLFSYGLREYQSIHPPRVAADNSSYRRVVRTSFSSIPPQPLQSLSNLLRQAPVDIPSVPSSAVAAEPQANNTNPVYQSTLRTTVPSLQVELSSFLNQTHEEEEEEEDEQPIQESQMITNALLSLLNIPTTGLTRTYDIDAFGAILGRGRNMDQFLQPVVIHPTAEQIAANTTLGNLVSDIDHACAICQDALTSEQQGRKLNACGHWFHQSCIDTWLERDVHCPVCRHDIREPLRQNTSDEEN